MTDEEMADKSFFNHDLTYKVTRDERSYKDGYLAGLKAGRQELDKAKEVIEGLMRFCRCFAQHHTEDIRYKEAEAFLREVSE